MILNQNERWLVILHAISYFTYTIVSSLCSSAPCKLPPATINNTRIYLHNHTVQIVASHDLHPPSSTFPKHVLDYINESSHSNCHDRIRCPIHRLTRLVGFQRFLAFQHQSIAEDRQVTSWPLFCLRTRSKLHCEESAIRHGRSVYPSFWLAGVF